MRLRAARGFILALETFFVQVTKSDRRYGTAIKTVFKVTLSLICSAKMQKELTVPTYNKGSLNSASGRNLGHIDGIKNLFFKRRSARSTKTITFEVSSYKQLFVYCSSSPSARILSAFLQNQFMLKEITTSFKMLNKLTPEDFPLV